MVCTGGLRSWMYVMTRAREPEPDVVEACLRVVESAGFDMNKVSVVPHDTP